MEQLVGMCHGVWGGATGGAGLTSTVGNGGLLSKSRHGQSQLLLFDPTVLEQHQKGISVKLGSEGVKWDWSVPQQESDSQARQAAFALELSCTRGRAEPLRHQGNRKQ